MRPQTAVPRRAPAAIRRVAGRSRGAGGRRSAGGRDNEGSTNPARMLRAGTRGRRRMAPRAIHSATRGAWERLGEGRGGTARRGHVARRDIPRSTRGDHGHWGAKQTPGDRNPPHRFPGARARTTRATQAGGAQPAARAASAGAAARRRGEARAAACGGAGAILDRRAQLVEQHRQARQAVGVDDARCGGSGVPRRRPRPTRRGPSGVSAGERQHVGGARARAGARRGCAGRAGRWPTGRMSARRSAASASAVVW